MNANTKRSIRKKFDKIFDLALKDGDTKTALNAATAIRDLEAGPKSSGKAIAPEKSSPQADRASVKDNGEDVDLAKRHLASLGIPDRSIDEMARLVVQKFVEMDQGKESE